MHIGWRRNKTPVPPRVDGKPIEADEAALETFASHMRANDPSGRKRAEGEFGASLNRNGQAGNDFFAYAHGDGVNIPVSQTTGSSHDIHSHPFSPNAAPAEHPAHPGAPPSGPT